MSILECILVDATNGEIKLTANDMELGIETTIEGQIVEKGIIALDIDLLLFGSERLHEGDWNRGYIKNLLLQLGVSVD
jgi:DNA polymerase-3 subunit beta